MAILIIIPKNTISWCSVPYNEKWWFSSENVPSTDAPATFKYPVLKEPFYVPWKQRNATLFGQRRKTWLKRSHSLVYPSIPEGPFTQKKNERKWKMGKIIYSLKKKRRKNIDVSLGKYWKGNDGWTFLYGKEIFLDSNKLL